MLNWLKSYITNRKQFVSFNGSLSTPAFITTGVPQGSIVGPLLFLMFINDLHSVVSSESVMFADDTTALSHGISHTEVSRGIQENLNMIDIYTARNHLVPHPKKTKSILFSKPSQYSQREARINLNLADKNIEYVSFYKCLGFTLDEHLHYNEHVKDMCKKVNYGLQIMRRVKDFLPQESLILLANSLVLSHLDYCSPLLHNLNSGQLDTLLKLQKHCARLIFSCNRLTRSKPLFIKLNWLPLHQRIEHNTCILMFKINNNMAPPYLTEMFRKISDVHSYSTRSSMLGLYTNRGAGNY